jgi:hypothetical protein
LVTFFIFLIIDISVFFDYAFCVFTIAEFSIAVAKVIVVDFLAVVDVDVGTSA